ncbi:MAG: hypothetical protein ACLQBQ_07375 [Smithella sp.]
MNKLNSNLLPRCIYLWGNRRNNLEEKNDQILSPCWYRIKILAEIVIAIGATIIIPLVIHYSTLQYSESAKERETSVRYVELATSILRVNPNDQRQELRSWAIDVVNHYATIKLSENARKDLMQRKLLLPIADGRFKADGSIKANGSAQ